MQRRNFLAVSAGATIASAAPTNSSATVLYADRAVPLDRVRVDGNELWVRAADLPRINEFELKPQGACRAELCIPVTKAMRQGEYFHLSAFARKIGEAYVADSGVWSFGEIPVLTGAYTESRQAPDFAVPDRAGKIVHLKDFRGKKVLVVTWASW
jgi:hypothetical protein